MDQNNPSYSRFGVSYFCPVLPDMAVTFVDSIGYRIQVKKDGVVGTNKVMIVSGRAIYDSFGRVKLACYPTVESDASLKYVFNVAFDSTASHIPSTRIAYDVLDRALLNKLPDGTSTRMSYSIDNGLMRTTVFDALGNKQKTFANGSGLTTKTVQYKTDNDSIVTQFEYDPINQPVTVTDAKGKQTKSVYDMAGRRTQVTHPASGITKFGYDAAGNVLWKYTANKDSIKYGYDFNRMKSITYPKHPENNVTYIYGASGASDNCAGRPVSIEDGSGKQVFKYGKQGEVTEVKRTLVIPNQAVATYTTKTAYDSWNRLMNMTYPDGEVVNYAYNTGGLLTGVRNNANIYVSDIKYDKFEQRTYMKYGNGAETNYAYNDSNRTLTGLSVKSTLLSGTPTLMSNAYTYDRVKNITQVVNTGSAIATTAGNGIGGAMTHNYPYDNLYRLKSANGTFTGYNGKTANYTLDMGYDNMHNITRKVQHITQNGVQFTGLLQAGYNLGYSYADNCQQIANIADTSYRAEGTVITPILKTQQFSYDANGNLLCINTGTKNGDKLQATNSRKMLWDEENRLLALSDNGFVSNYWYDALGERTVKESGDGEGVNVNGLTSAGRTGTINFTAYISPYLVVNNGGNYTKHIYMGGQRITSKVSNSGIFTTSPVNNTDLKAKYDILTAGIKTRYDSLGVVYKGTAQTGGLISKSSPSGVGTYYYHSDHLGSSSLITDQSGAIVQHIEYVPFGETFVDERKSQSSWTTPYLFSGKERDEETGLLYFGARYQDSKYGIWYSVDPLAEKSPNVSSYVYCLDNPVKHIDPDGRFPILINGRVGKDSERASRTYWSKSIRETIKAGTGYYHSQFMYVDGDKGRLPSTRINAGMVQGKADAASVYARLKGSVKNGQITEQLQAFSHSRGSAFASGYMQGLSAGIILLAEKDKIGFAYGKENIFQYSVNLAPHQSNWINYGNGTGSVNLNISHIGDPLSGNDATGNVINVQSIPEYDAFDQHGNATYNTELNFVLKILENNTGNGNPTDQVKAGYLIYDKNRTNGDKSKVTQGSN